MSTYDFDLFVIGAGSGGVRAARIAGGHGARVGIAEEYRYGGTCVIRGCVPKKLFSYGSEYGDMAREAAGFGWTIGDVAFSWPTLIANKDKEIARLEGVYRRLLDGSKVKMFDARATLVDAHTLDVGGAKVTAETILIATGGAPVKPPFPGADLAITSNEAFHLPDLPPRIAILGAGYIAVEFAGIFHGYGAEVTQFFRGEQILRGFDEDVRQHLAQEMTKKGVALRPRSEPARLERAGDAYRLTLKDGTSVVVDAVMAATGRRPNTANLGLEKVGAAVDGEGAVVVDEWSRTTVANIYAVGDVTDRIALTPVAIHEGHCFADTVFGGRPRRPDHLHVASAVFSHPNVAVVGLSEQDAESQGFAVDVYRATFTPMRHTLSGGTEKVLMKLVVDAVTDRVLGVHMVGPEAAEVVQGLAICVKAGLTKAQWDATIGIHPSAAEEFVTMRTPTKRATRAAAE